MENFRNFIENIEERKWKPNQQMKGNKRKKWERSTQKRNQKQSPFKRRLNGGNREAKIHYQTQRQKRGLDKETETLEKDERKICQEKKKLETKQNKKKKERF